MKQVNSIVVGDKEYKLLESFPYKVIVHRAIPKLPKIGSVYYSNQFRWKHDITQTYYTSANGKTYSFTHAMLHKDSAPVNSSGILVITEDLFGDDGNLDWGLAADAILDIPTYNRNFETTSPHFIVRNGVILCTKPLDLIRVKMCPRVGANILANIVGRGYFRKIKTSYGDGTNHTYPQRRLRHSFSLGISDSARSGRMYAGIKKRSRRYINYASGLDVTKTSWGYIF